ncbi:MAG: translation elongation factor Ts [Candidatus Gracilibacteria bacterium]|jgi:elongation factor Ts
MAITIDDIKKLRETTGVSMTACKKALEEANGDFDGAIDVLRKKGEAKASDRIGRSTTQGVIAVAEGSGKVAMIQLESETDFVSRGDEFVKLADDIAKKALEGTVKVTDRELPEIKDFMLKVGENVQIGNIVVVEGSNIGIYIHSNKKIGVIVSLDGGTNELAKDVAMHAAATNPRVISPDEVAQELVNKEKEIWADQLKNEGKPEAIVEKIMIGKEKKFREENALLKQMFVKDPEKSIEQILGEAKIKQFVRFGI